MASLQRSAVSFRRQGSSGIVWENKYYLEEDGKVELRELRQCQSVKENTTTFSHAAPATCPRSFSTPATNQPVFINKASGGSFFGVSWKMAAALKSKSGKKKP